jgi:hypothetical protein
LTARTRTSASVRHALAIARPSARLTAGIAATTAIGAIALTAAAPWASAATPAPFIGPAQPAHAATVNHATATAHAATSGTTRAASTTPAKHATAAHTAAKPATPAKPSTIYDSVTASSIPAGADAAVYADGSYQATTASVAGHKHVLWIDTNGSRTDASVLDVEPGDATPAGAAAWVKAKLTATPHATAIVYTFKSDWAPTIAAIDTLPASMQSHVKYWIADPTGTPHILPGAAATQWYWGANYDISNAQPGFTS